MKIFDQAFLDNLLSEHNAIKYMYQLRSTFDPSSPIKPDDLIEQRRIKFMKSISELLEVYEFKCKHHDWYYAYSDDHSYWMAGEKSIKELIAMGKTLDDLGQSFHRQNIYNRYCPWAKEDKE